MNNHTILQTKNLPLKKDHYPVTKQILEKTIDKLQKLSVIMDLDYNDQKEVKELQDLISYLIHAQIQITIKQHLANREKE